jgi:nucleoside-diphosphate-sugar epimerase
MMNSKRVLITGSQGYIGSVLAPLLLKAGYDVVGLDSGYFQKCTLVQNTPILEYLSKDIRNVTAADLAGFYAVIHLAALSNDPIGNLNPDWTEDINFRASERLAQIAKAAGVERFLFSSSCIMYGASEAALVTEDSPLAPKTEYARSKVRCEYAIAKLASEGFSPTFLRNGTVYGLSPRMRFDTVVNNLMGSALTTGRVMVYSDGKPWRPTVHVKDVSQAFLEVLQAPVEKVHNQIFNTGANHVNHMIRDIAETVARIVPDCRVELLAQSGADQRTYRTDFTKFARTFPDFEFRWTLENGVVDLYQALTSIPLTHDIFVDKKFTRLHWLRHLLETGQLDGALRWTGHTHSAQNGTNA